MSFLNEVLTSAQEIEMEQINEKCPEIVEAVDVCKNNILTYLDNVYVKFRGRPKRNKALSNKLAQLQEDVNNLTNNIEQLMKKDLVKAEIDLKKHLTSLTRAKCAIQLVDTLYRISEELKTLKELKETQSYLACMKKIMELESFMDSIPSSEKLQAVEELSYTLEAEKTSFFEEMSNIMKKNIILEIEKDKSTLKLGDENVLTEILSAMYFYNTSIVFLDDLTKFLWHQVFVAIVDYTTEIKTNVDDNYVIMEVITVDQSKKSSYAEVFANIKIVLNFLSSNCNVSLDEDLTTLSYIGRDLGDNLSELIIKHCLQDTIPETTEDLKKYPVIIEATEDLEKMLLMTHIFAEDTTSILEYAKNIDILFINKKSQNYLVQAQTLMKKDLHDLVEVGVAEDTEKSLEVTLDFPRCAVSSSVLELLRLMETILTDASTSSEMCAQRLVYTMQNICQNYVKFVPEHHKKLLQTIPQQIAVFYNNCTYISYKLTEWNERMLKLLPMLNGLNNTFTDEGHQLEEVASNMFRSYVEGQIKQIEEIMKEAGLQQHTLDKVENSTEKCLRQCLRQQELLRTVWHKVLPYSVYNKTLGTILNSLCNNVINTVLKCEDISVDAAEQLIELFKMVQMRGPKLFTDPKEVTLFVASWDRLNELVFVLNATLLDINDRWADGKGPLALQFKPEELKQLIRALFQNTERRAVLLAKIHD